MSAMGADPRSKRVLRREGRTWGLIRRILLFGRSIASLLYLVTIGLIATWTIAVFFGVSLFFLVPPSAKLATGPSLVGDRLNASSADMPWLLQSTSRLDHLSTSRPFEPPRPLGDGASDKNAPIVAPASRDTTDVKPRSMPSEPTTAHIVKEPQGQVLSVLTGTGEPAPASPPESEAAAAAGPRSPAQASQSDSSRTRHVKKSATNKAPSAHPPQQAIQDVLLKHSRLLK
jgi:hypothetical protein